MCGPLKMENIIFFAVNNSNDEINESIGEALYIVSMYLNRTEAAAITYQDLCTTTGESSIENKSNITVLDK